MSRTMIQAAVTMNQLQHKLDVIGHNLANSQTTGYKSRQAEFSSLLFQQINNMTNPSRTEERATPEGLQIGSGATLGSIHNDLTPGPVSETGRVLDTALLEANHLFQMQVTDGNNEIETRYTRDGSFYLNPINNNQSLLLTTKDGHPVVGENGPIVIDADFESIEIQPNGQLVVQRNNQTEMIGQISIVEAVRPRMLESIGENAFRLPNLDILGSNAGAIIQNVDQEIVLGSGALENANVDLSKQMTEMMVAQRSYQFNARTISMSDQMMGLINQLR